MNHNELIKRGETWLKKQHCKITIRDECRIYTSNNEQPDVIGWRDNVSILIECKSSRADFLKDKTKTFRADPNLGMGDWRFYLCPPKIILPEDLPEGWGLLWATPKTIQKIAGIDGNTSWYSKKPFAGDKHCENQMLVSALRRLTLRGYLPEIYKGDWKN